MSGKETVVLLHGLSRTPRSMRRLEAALSESGYAVLNVGYRAGRRPIEDLSDDLGARLAEIGGAPERRIHFVTHSFGGILLRYYLRDRRLPQLGGDLKLRPPNGGRELRDLLRQLPLVPSTGGTERPRIR